MREFHSPNTLFELNSVLNEAQSRDNSVYFSTSTGIAYVIRIGANDKIYYAYVGTNENAEISWGQFQKMKTEFWEDVKQ